MVTSTRDPAATPASDAAVDARYTSVLVPLDGSDMAERALVPAQRLAKGFDAAVHVVASARRDERWWYEGYVGQLRGRIAGTTTQVSDEPDPVRAIVAAARGLDPCIICLATHGRSRSAAIVGSTFARIAAERVGPARRGRAAGVHIRRSRRCVRPPGRLPRRYRRGRTGPATRRGVGP